MTPASPPAGGFRTRGQAAAVDAVRAMLRAGMPHAVLLAGAPGVGKGTLAEDLAAALLCLEPDPGARPDRTCRACRAVEHGNHPDVHRLEPTGAGAVIPIGGPGREERGVRDLVRELVHRHAEVAEARGRREGTGAEAVAVPPQALEAPERLAELTASNARLRSR